MLKGQRALFRSDRGGQDPDLWEANWEGVDLSAAVDAIARSSHPLNRALYESTASDDLVLESGCGSAQYVAYLDRAGRRTVGVDFAVATLARSKMVIPGLRLAAANVQRLPFAEGTFDAVVSLGVIEHFEEGPESVLAEHRRVLRDAGTLILVVPRLSPLKRWADFRSLTVRRRRSYVSRRGLHVTRVRALRPSPTHAAQVAKGNTFYQYEISARLMRRMLAQSGFDVVQYMACSPNFEALESRLLRRLGRQLVPRTAIIARAQQPADAPAEGNGVLSQGRRRLAGMMSSFAGHTHLFVARGV